MGGLVGHVPFVCNSGSCYALQQSGSWQKDRYATGEKNAAIGSMVLHNKLVIAGGSGRRLSTIKVASPNTRTTLSVRLPVETSSSCIVPWDDNTFMVIGGFTSDGATTRTYFVNMNTERLTNGPSLLKARGHMGCNEIIVNGESYIIVAGGTGASASTEYLSKSSTGNKWKTGPNLPTRLGVSRTVVSTDKRSLHTFGNGRKNIYQFSCSGGITTCKWIENAVQLKNKRWYFVAFTIPDTLAYKLCN